jgi:hypothetical protein
MSDEDGRKAEYLDLSNNMRFYANLRFAQLTLLFAVTAVLLSKVFESTSTDSTEIAFVIKIGGLIITILFIVIEKRGTKYYFCYRERAEELEKVLGYSQYTDAPKRGMFTASRATVGIMYVIIGLWLCYLVFPCLIG